eukprot:scaffold9959_cov52-Cylindrotheca_fusiformis.AAC.2
MAFFPIVTNKTTTKKGTFQSFTYPRERKKERLSTEKLAFIYGAIIPSHDETIDEPSSSRTSNSNRLQPEEVAKTVEEALQALQLNDEEEEEEVNKEEDEDFATISEEPITFSDDELVAALWGIDNNTNSTTTSQEEAETEEENYYNNDDWNGWLEPLPDIDLDFGESFNNNKDSVEFLDPEHLGSIFDSHHEEEEEENNNYYYTGEEENIPPESSSLSFLDDDDEEEESAFLDLDTE